MGVTRLDARSNVGITPAFSSICADHVASQRRCNRAGRIIDRKRAHLSTPATEHIRNHAAFIWSVADLLRGDYKQSEYGRVILPLTVLRRLDCVLEPTKQQVLDRAAMMTGRAQNLEPILCRASKQDFYNTSKLDFGRLLDAPDDLADNLRHYVASFSSAARDVIDKFDFDAQITRLDRSNLLYLVVSKFAEIDLHPDAVSNIEMGYLYEELIRRFSELSNETAGEHFTPREVIRLMVNLLFIEDGDLLTKPGISKTMLDPACGTGGMLSVAEDLLRELNADARLHVYGQELNAETYAICRSDMMLKGQDAGNIFYGNSFSEDGHQGGRFDYLLANPPFGVEWKKVADTVRDEAEAKGFAGRFGAGLPRINDGSFLFLQHMISKMKPVEQGGSRVAIVFNGSPLFTGAAGSGESEIRRWIIENDWLEAIVALPDQLFYNTGINTYLWIVTNRKEPNRKGKIQLVDGTSFFKKMRKSLGNKRNEVCDNQRDEITRLYGSLTEGEHVRVFDNTDFGYQRITVERPLRLNFAVDEQRLARLQEAKPFAKLATSRKRKDTKAAQAEIEAGRKQQDDILAALRTVAGQGVVKEREAFTGQMKTAFKKADLKVPAALFKAILMALAERDETAEICTDKKGNPEADSDLRDYENVPLKETIKEYMKREVLPHVPDAWVDESKTKIGYEINFNRYFYQYTPPRPLDEIEADLKRTQGEIVIYQPQQGNEQIRVLLEGETVWLTQRLIAELFGVSVKTVNEHLINIYDEGELDTGSTIRKFRIVQTEGKSRVTRLLDHYSLDAILAVGYRTQSPVGTAFRQWATARLSEYLVKGFTLNDDRLKGTDSVTDYFDELLARIREIRASEARVYQRIREVFSLACDYREGEQETQIFFATMQNKMHHAATGMTAAEIIRRRADASKPNMGAKTWKGGRVLKRDIGTAKNYLDDQEIDTLNRITVMFPNQAEFRAQRRRLAAEARAETQYVEDLRTSAKMLETRRKNC